MKERSIVELKAQPTVNPEGCARSSGLTFQVDVGRVLAVR